MVSAFPRNDPGSIRTRVRLFFFQPLSILISLENGQIHLHIKSWWTFSTFPRKCREIDWAGSFYLENGGHLSDPLQSWKFQWGCFCEAFDIMGKGLFGQPNIWPTCCQYQIDMESSAAFCPFTLVLILILHDCFIKCPWLFGHMCQVLDTF